jgi:cytochrome c-type biogenesis protein CcmH/NrfF
MEGGFADETSEERNELMNHRMTNAILAVIAILLLVLVIQNFSRQTSKPSKVQNPHMAREDMPSGPAPIVGEGSGGGSAAPMVANGGGDSSEFHPTSMILRALNCPNDLTMTLADSGCTGTEAEKRKKVAEEAFNQGLSISKVFDAVIEKFGEGALTSQALEIRRSRRAANAGK